jgi:hypothetical protein
MRLHLLLACLAFMPDSCDSGVDAVKSYYPLVARSNASCEPALTGAWVLDADSAGPVVWTVMGADPSDSSCALALVLVDSSIARVLLDSAEMEWIWEDSVARAGAKLGDATRARYLADGEAIEALIGPGEGSDSTLTVWDVRAVRRPAGLFVDFSREELPATPFGSAPIQTHWLWKAELAGGRLTLRPFSREWLEAMSDSGRVAVSHSKVDGAFVLTGSGEEVVALMERFAADSQAFPETWAIHLRR